MMKLHVYMCTVVNIHLATSCVIHSSNDDDDDDERINFSSSDNNATVNA